MYKQYEEYVGREFSVDYWSDEGITQASLMLTKFDDSDWRLLVESCADKPDAWRLRCAETLGDIADARALVALLGLLRSESVDVRVAALDSIRSLISGGVDVSEFTHDISEAVKRIKVSASIDQVVELVLDSLERKLN